MNKRLLIVIGSVVLVVILLAIAKSRGKGEVEVETARPTYRTIVETVAANGKIQPETEVKISADVSGEITNLYVEEGDTVESGQLLLTIDEDLYVTAVDRAKANLNSARSSLNSNQALVSQAESRFLEARLLYERNKSLLEDGVISQAEFDNISTTYHVAKSEVGAAKERVLAAKYGVQNAQASLKEALKNLSRTKIYSPSDGVISQLNSEQGERVVGTAQMQGTEILVISNFSNMEVQVDVNENDILEVSRGDTVVVEVDAYDNRQFKGIVTEIAKSAIGGLGQQMSSDQITNFEVKIRILKMSYEDLLEVSEAPFLRGMSASVEIQTDVQKDVLSLPIEAVTTRPRYDSLSKREELDEIVFVIKDKQAVKTVVKTGIQDNRYIRVTEGLNDSVTVVKGPYDVLSSKLEDGDPIAVKSDKKKRSRGM